MVVSWPGEIPVFFLCPKMMYNRHKKRAVTGPPFSCWYVAGVMPAIHKGLYGI